MKETHWYMFRRTVVAVLLIVIVGAVTGLAMRNISRRAEQRCWDELGAYAEELGSDIRLVMEGDRTLLRTAAKLIADYGLLDSPDLSAYLKEFESDVKEFETEATIAKIGLLLPGDTVISSNGKRYDVSGRLSFAAEAALGEHITGRVESLDPELGYVLRHFVPVKEDGQTVAMLYGAVQLKTLPCSIHFALYDGTESIYLIDVDTGDYLLDTWHGELGSVYELEGRENRQGYSIEELIERFRSLTPGYVEFISRSTGQCLYFYYTPCGISNWLVAVSVPEETAFAEVLETRALLLRLAVWECVCFALYFLWVIFDTRREALMQQRRIDMITYIYDVEKILFTAHREEEKVRAALERICRMTAADEAFFVIYGPPRRLFLFSRRERPALADRLERSDAYRSFCEAYSPDRMPDGVRLVPVSDVDGNLTGALGVSGWKHSAGLDDALAGVAPSFTLLHHNIKNFNRIKEMSEKDLLTGLLNRNSFENNLERYAHTAPVAAVYADANGLHELNNSQGHEAGDRMLQFVAARLQEQFGPDHTYRIGGDEFAAFAPGLEEEAIRERLRAVDDALTRAGYHASIGMAREEAPGDLDALLKLAEQRMYEAKRQWYQRKGNDRRARR